jgi:hypothetical protein
VDIASEIPEACQEFMKAEAHVIEYVRSGTPTMADFAKARDAMSADVKTLAKRLRRT